MKTVTIRLTDVTAQMLADLKKRQGKYRYFDNLVADLIERDFNLLNSRRS